MEGTSALPLEIPPESESLEGKWCICSSSGVLPFGHQKPRASKAKCIGTSQRSPHCMAMRAAPVCTFPGLALTQKPPEPSRLDRTCLSPNLGLGLTNFEPNLLNGSWNMKTPVQHCLGQSKLGQNWTVRNENDAIALGFSI